MSCIYIPVIVNVDSDCPDSSPFHAMLRVPLQSPALLPKASRCLHCLVWRLELHGRRWSCCCCWLHRHHPCSRLCERNHRYPHRGVGCIPSGSGHALLNCGVHSSHPRLLTSLMTVSAKNQNSKEQQDHYGYFKWSYCP